MLFLASLIFIVLFYIIPLRLLVIQRLEFFPFLGPVGSYLPTSALIYIVILLVLHLIKQFHDLLWPNLSYFLKEELERRTGISNIEAWGFRLSAVGLIIFLTTDLTMVPLSMAALLGFGWLLTRPVSLRAVGAVREVKRSPQPVTDQLGAADEASRGNQVKRQFNWQFERVTSEPFIGFFDIICDDRRYRMFKDKNPFRETIPSVHNYKQFVSGGITDEVAQVAENLISISNEQGFSNFEEIANALSFVQAIPLRRGGKSNGKPYFRYPLETLFEQEGDGVSKAILLAAILKTMNYDLLILESTAEVAVAVAGAEGIPGRFLEHHGRRYFYCVNAESGQKIGQIPPDKAGDQFKIFTV